MKPIVKWAGGKSQLLPEISKRLPKEYGCYYEPFFGGGALYFHLCPSRAIINDYNEQLMNLYIQLRDNETSLRCILGDLQSGYNESEDKSAYYYNARDRYNLILPECTVLSAAYLLFLNKAGYNGLYRLNSMGEYNVPSARRKKVNLYDESNFSEVHNQLQSATILSTDFEEACKDAKEGDFVFFDSPYYNTFDTYKSDGFSIDNHIRLSNLYRELTKKGVKCILTNSNEDYIKNLYSGFEISVVKVKRLINSDANNRKGEEIIVRNYD